MPSPADFLAKLRQSFAEETFVKLTLSEYAGTEPGLRNLYARMVDLKEGRRVSLLRRYATRDVTKNVAADEAAAQVVGYLEGGFRKANLFTRTGDWQWRSDGKMKASRPAFTAAPALEHDREKARPSEVEHAPFLRALGITNAAGEARPSGVGKLHQIRRFVELLGHFAPETPPRRVLDLGAGKGYLTFALAEFLRRRGQAAEVVGVEQREELVALANRVAAETEMAGLRFVAKTVTEYQPPEPPDWVIALHACNTATDDAIFLGIRSGAELIVVAPCCHQEVRPQMTLPPVLEPVLRHGILLEHEAAHVTDAIRALLLEIHGYKASVLEFVDSEHTGKNLMIAAQKRRTSRDPEPFRAQLAALHAFYGIRQQRLADLLR